MPNDTACASKCGSTLEVKRDGVLVAPNSSAGGSGKSERTSVSRAQIIYIVIQIGPYADFPPLAKAGIYLLVLLFASMSGCLLFRSNSFLS